jgi:type I restriction enzyme S subunit
VNKPPSSPTLRPSTRQGQNVLALGGPVGLAGTLLGLIEHPIAIGRLRALIIELATSGRLRQRKTGAFRLSTIGPAPEQLPEGWVRLPLSELAVDFQNGIAKRSGDRGTPIPVLRLADITRLKLKETELREIILTPEEQTKYQVDRGDFLVIRVNGSGGLVGRFIPCTVQRRWAYSDHLIRVRPRADLVDQRYLCLFANSETARRHLVNKTVTTAGQKTINQGGLGSLPVVVPPIEEPKRIVAKVDQLMALCDDLETKQNKKRDLATQSTRSALTALTTAETAEDLSTAWHRVEDSFLQLVGAAADTVRMRDAVVDLAIRGRLSSRLDGDGTGADLLAVLIKEAKGKPNRVTSSGKPEVNGIAPAPIPGTWTWARLADLWRAVTDGDHQPPPKSTTGVPFLTIGNVSKGFLDFSSTRFVSRAYFDDLGPDRVPRKGDLIYTVVGSFGRALFVNTDEEFCVQRHIAILKPLPSTYVPFMRLVMNSPFVYGQAAAGATGIAQPTVGLGVLRRFAIPLPPLAEQKRIVGKVDHLMSLLDDLEAKLRKQEETATRLAESLAAAVAA